MLLNHLSKYLESVDPSTPHFQELDTYPHHKHLSERVITVERPTIIDVIEEATLLAGETSV